MKEYVPLVSVIINTRNDVEYIRDTIDSVYAQTYQNFEILVYDNASQVDVKQSVHGYDERLHYHRSDIALTLGAARNAALHLARGELIDFLDADDLFLPDKLSLQIPYFANEAVGLVFGISEHFVVENGVPKTTELVEAPNLSSHVFAQLLEQFFISWDTAIFRTVCLGDDPSYWFNEEFNICTDYDLFLRIAHGYEIAYLPMPVSRWRSHASNLSKLLSLREPMEKLSMVPRILGYEPNLFKKYPTEMKRFLTKIYLAQGNYHWERGLKSEAWICSLHAFLLTLNRSALIKMLLIPFLSYERGMEFKQ